MTQLRPIPRQPSVSERKTVLLAVLVALLLHVGIGVFAYLHKTKVGKEKKSVAVGLLMKKRKPPILAATIPLPTVPGTGMAGASRKTTTQTQTKETAKAATVPSSASSTAQTKAKVDELMKKMGLGAGISLPKSGSEGEDFAGVTTGGGGSDGSKGGALRGTEGAATAQAGSKLEVAGPTADVGTGTKSEKKIDAPKSEDAPAESEQGVEAYDANMLGRLFKEKIPAFKYCYNSAMKRNPSSTSSYANFHVKVSNEKALEIDITVGEKLREDNVFMQCLEKYTRAIQFPKQKKPYEAAYALSFVGKG